MILAFQPEDWLIYLTFSLYFTPFPIKGGFAACSEQKPVGESEVKQRQSYNSSSANEAPEGVVSFLSVIRAKTMGTVRKRSVQNQFKMRTIHLT